MNKPLRATLSTFAIAALVSATQVHGDPTTQPTSIRPLDVEHQLAGYSLTWSDEFDGDALNTDVWLYRTDSKHWSTQLPENVSVARGHLRIALKKEPAQGKQYTAGGVITKRAFKYGYYEAAMKVPRSKGWHSAFWAMKYDVGTGTSSSTALQELDFVEQDSVNTKTYSAGVIDWSKNKKDGQHVGRKYVKTPDLSDDFHVWGCEFTPTRVRFFFDGKLTHETDATKFPHNEQAIWLTCIATWYGNTDKVDDAGLPALALFDWVRFYEKRP